MKYSEIINSLQKYIYIYISVFTEAQRFISKSIRFKNINNLNLEQINPKGYGELERE